MLGIHDYWVFLAAGIALNLTPGQDTIYIAGRSIAEGRRVGIASALGVGTGCLVHVTAAALGLSAILSASAFAFSFVKWVGVAYLVYLGVRLFVSPARENPWAPHDNLKEGAGNAYRRGILTNVLNPKVAVFFLAFLPQFVDAGSSYKTLAFMILGCTFVFTGTVWCLIVAVVSARASEKISRSERAQNLMRRISGVVFVGLGVKLALERAK